MTTEWRRKMSDGPVFRFTYLWSAGGPATYDIDLSASGCNQKINWNRVADVHILDRGDYKRYLKGYQLDATLTWGRDALIPEHHDDIGTVLGRTEKLMQLMFNSTCEEDIFYWPYPTTHPSTYFSVIWSNDYDFNYAEGLVGVGFQGKIQLVGKDILEHSKTFTSNF